MSNRVMLIISGVVICYFAIYFGDGLYTMAVAELAAPRAEKHGVILLAAALGFIMAIVGGIAWAMAMTNCLLSNVAMREDPHIIAAEAAVAFICLGCLFGILSGPFANYGAYPYSWMSRWSWLPLLAFIPTAIQALDVITEAIDRRRKKKESPSNVTAIRRDTA